MYCISVAVDMVVTGNATWQISNPLGSRFVVSLGGSALWVVRVGMSVE